MQNPTFVNLGTSNSDDIWFVSSVGNVKEQLARNSTEIEVLLYPLRSSKKDFTGNNNQLELKRRLINSIEIGLTSIVSPGQLIHRDKIISDASENFTTRTFNFTIPEVYQFNIRNASDFLLKTIEWIPKGKTKSVPIPVWDFPWAPTFSRAQFLCLPEEIHNSGHYDYILIPCTEIIRYYFSTSDKLTQALFAGGLHAKENTLFDPLKLTSQENLEKGGVAYIHLRKNLPDTDALVVGRIAYSQIAMKAAKAIYNKIQKDHINQLPPNPESFFPYNGNSEITLCGTDIKASGKFEEYNDKKIFLVYNILKCTGSLPFKHLQFGRENDGRQDENSNPTKRLSSRFGIDSNVENPKIDSNQTPQTTAKGISISELMQRFSGTMAPEKVDKRDQKTRTEGPYAILEDSNVFSTNPNIETKEDEKVVGRATISINSSSINKREENYEKEVYKPEQYASFFYEVVSLLKNNLHLQDELITDDNSQYKYLDPKPFKPKTEQYRFSHREFDKKLGKWIGGRAVIVNRLSNHLKREFILFDRINRITENSGGAILLVHKYNFEPIDSATIKEILLTFSENAKIGLESNQMRELERYAFDHQMKSGAYSVYSLISKILDKRNFKQI